ncbi:MAG: T9SS type A sorting domain-containing protein [Bacteroidales bacterium]|nr:T9SS type A sorting domain-containing protein [Bacteroidales bacterium]
MKKILLTAFATLLAVALNAQVSVWDGSYEPFDTIHAGTEDDPILIENAAQFASLQRHTRPFKNFKLMTDIDLNNIDWYPIGYSSVTYLPFHGCFDGNGHTIYHLTTTLFSCVESGCIKNLTIRDSDIVVQYGVNVFAGIANWVPLIENCHNYGNVILYYDEGDNSLSWDMGGIVGCCGTIRKCSNHGKLMVIAESRINNLTIGGIAGNAGIVEESYNEGEISIDSEIHHLCCIGGICGQLFNKAQYCYNTTDLSVACDESYAGGIVGSIYLIGQDSVSITSCYNYGNIEAENVGGIIAKTDYEVTLDVDNCYYLNTISSDNDYGTPKSEDEMKSEDFVSLLNTDEEMFFMDTYGYLNDGYPILKWQHESHVGVDETDWNGKVEVYPNPTDGILTINGDNLQTIEVVNILGQTVLKTSGETGEVTVDLENRPSGIYLLKLTDAKGGKQTVKIVVKH